ncbi:ABC transporter ATP-binding protein [Bowmanella sp. Y26]|uniref:ABC transporter ATP-binding protein n=1 Tax=Bowmanella yangjiangensis TaxID=2811230 RepID=UPI001BDC574F|nr:ABC transporter ATP-binding protein [Bowmanella yangjiangensis]MBT1064613.1 ABC transporter ATP-binding protein [Bowmanella yangjiangensis]
MIELRHVSKAFGGHLALDDLSFKVQTGEVMCLLGANGAGKSTTLNILLDFVAPDSGEAWVEGINVQLEPHKSKQRLVYLPENVNLYQEFNAIDNLSYLARLCGNFADLNEIKDALQKTGLQEDAWLQPLASYSKGMRQKVGIAFAILRRAKVLLLDEPTSGLDPSATREFIKIIEQLAKQGAAILMVTHDLYCAHTLASHIGIMKRGRLLDVLANRQLSLDSLEHLYHQHISGISLEKTA